MSRRARLWIVISLAGGLTGPVAALDASSAHAQGAARLDLVAQTTFVGADPAVIDIRVLGAPENAVLAVRIHEAVTTRAGLRSSVEGDPPTDVISLWTVDDLDAIRIGAGDVLSVVVPDEEIGELLRRPADPGPHPVVIDLVVGDRVLDSLSTHLLVRAPEGAATGRLTVALLFDLRIPAAIGADGSSSVDTEALAEATELASALAARVELPMTVRLPPQTFQVLEEDGPAASFDTLRTAAVGNSVLTAPWVDLDEEAWRLVGRPDIVTATYELGREALEASASIGTDPIVALGPTAGPATIGLLAADPIGATGFVVSPDVVLGVPGGLTAPVMIQDSNGVLHRGVVPDEMLEELMADPDPELAVQNTLAELLRMALSVETSAAGVTMAVEGVDPIALDLLLDGLDRPSPLIPGTVGDVVGLPPAELAAGAAVVARLTPDEAADLTSHVENRLDLEQRLGAYQSLISGNEALIEPLRGILQASVADEPPDPRDSYLDFVNSQVDDGLQGVELIESGRITITSREAQLPIVIRNDQTLPVTVVLALSAEKIDFPDGDRQSIVLKPGENPISLGVEALASGDSVINLTIETPEGAVELAAGVVRLRSTAISGLGLLISIVALAVLVFWWIQTIRQRRARGRGSRPDSVAGAEGDRGEEPADHLAGGGAS